MREYEALQLEISLLMQETNSDPLLNQKNLTSNLDSGVSKVLVQADQS